MTNIAILTGRIARDPDTRETKGGTNVTGTVAINASTTLSVNVTGTLGGSQGAKALNERVPAALALLPETARPLPGS